MDSMSGQLRIIKVPFGTRKIVRKIERKCERKENLEENKT